MYFVKHFRSMAFLLCETVTETQLVFTGRDVKGPDAEFAKAPRTRPRGHSGSGSQGFRSSKVLKSDLSQQARNVKWLQNRPEATKCKAAEPEPEWNLPSSLTRRKFSLFFLGRSQHLSRRKVPPLNTSVKRGSGRLTSFMASNLVPNKISAPSATHTAPMSLIKRTAGFGSSTRGSR